MLSFGTLGFADPWLLAALLGLPVLWWLLRVMPPQARRVPFPPLRLLLGLRPVGETPQRTPLWLLLFRLFVAALLIVALAHPLLYPAAGVPGRGPLLLVVDNGFAAAPHWRLRIERLENLLSQAARQDRPAMLLETAPKASGGPIAVPQLSSAARLKAMVGALKPEPWATDRKAVIRALHGLELGPGATVVWLSDGIGGSSGNGGGDSENGARGGSGAALATALARLGHLEILHERETNLPYALLSPELTANGLKVRARRASDQGPASIAVVASGAQGQILARHGLSFAPGERAAEATLVLPLPVRDRITRIAIEGEDSAAAVVLLDSGFRRRPVGLVTTSAAGSDQPLLSSLYYLKRALEPYAEVETGTLSALLRRRISVLVLADIGKLTGPERGSLRAWLDQGGELIRFAGPHLAADADKLLPVRLLPGERALGGAFTWAKPEAFAPFPASSPFAGLDVPSDVRVRRQVLAVPMPGLASHTWARLTDGTPVVTAARTGLGWLVLVHTTANAEWSNLALSGLFVEMLRRLTALSRGIAAGTPANTPLKPYAQLDGFGRLGPPSLVTAPLTQAEFAKWIPGPRHPPGLYGSPGTLRALNLGDRLGAFSALSERPGDLPAGTTVGGYGGPTEHDLMPGLLALALLLAAFDLLLALGLGGLLPRRAAATASLAVVAIIIVGGIGSARADGSKQTALDAATRLHLAYVLTGDADVDATSKAGIATLGRVLTARTSVEPAAPVAIHIDSDPILFFPLLYWPMTADEALPSAAALQRIDAYLKTGGVILFDTRDEDRGGLDATPPGPNVRALRRILGHLDVPPLEPLPTDHVLTKSFYLIQTFPGRWAGGRLWVARPSVENDGVSPLVIGSNDWAAAWAADTDGRWLDAVVPGGERQREMAFRFGINLVMYALTGNYKADQVHAATILERLGQ